MAESFEEYLKRRHRNRSVNKKILRETVRQVTGKPAGQIRRLKLGETNEIYEVGVEKSKPLIVRVSKKQHQDFSNEEAIMKQVRDLGVPVANNLLITHLKRRKYYLSFCVQNKLPGNPLERAGKSIFDMPPGEVRKILRQAGKILAKVHSIKLDGYGWINSEGKPKFKEFTELMDWELRNKEGIVELAKKHGLGIGKINKIFRIIEKNLELIRPKQPVLIHGDFGPQHLMYDGTKIVGVLDWGSANGHTPENDIAHFEFWFGDKLPIEWLLEGYENKDGLNMDKIKILKLIEGIRCLRWYEKNSYNDGIKNVFDRLISSSP